MEKNSYYVLSFCNDGKKYATARKLPNLYNLKGWFEIWNQAGLQTANACDTLRDAERIADEWNAIYREQGCYAFS